MIATFYIVCIIIERIIEKTLKEKFLLATYQATNNIVLGLITFGASNFQQFLIAYFIGMGIQMFQRPYFTLLTEEIFTWLERNGHCLLNQ